MIPLYSFMKRYFIEFSYDGTAYHGWQIQPNGVSVQEILQKALSLVLHQKLLVVGAGRTDAGVHARKMVAHFDLKQSIEDCNQLKYRMNRLLPSDISIETVREVCADMHARFSAHWRTYRYYIHLQKDPFLKYYSLETHYQLDFKKMNKAGEILCTHSDFASFCKAGADNKTTLCHLKECKWIELGDGKWYMTITANRFLRNMVRAVVGTMFLIGRGKMTLDEFEGVLKHGHRSEAGESMPGHALFLWDIIY